MTQAFETAWARKEKAQHEYLLAITHSERDTIDIVLSATLAYIDAAHDAMQVGLELLARGE